MQKEGFDLPTMICHAASDYKYGRTTKTFANTYGGIDALLDELLWLVEQWEQHPLNTVSKDSVVCLSQGSSSTVKTIETACSLLRVGELVYIPNTCPAGKGGQSFYTPNGHHQRDDLQPCPVSCKFQQQGPQA